MCFRGGLAGDEASVSQPGGWNKTYEISQEQFQQIQDFANGVLADPGTYVGIGNNCTDFVRDALQAGDVPHPLGLGPHPASLIPPRERDPVRAPADLPADSLWDLEGWGDLFNDARNAVPPPPTCPIILDLDGDGIETKSITNGAYFDHDGNGFAERSGWALSDDGILALDRNADGVINNGSELFGNQTLLSDGSRATNGYQALAELDQNSDGRIDSSDSAYSNLVVWRDLDGDGYSDNGELSTLEALGIESIKETLINSSTLTRSKQ